MYEVPLIPAPVLLKAAKYTFPVSGPHGDQTALFKGTWIMVFLKMTLRNCELDTANAGALSDHTLHNLDIGFISHLWMQLINLTSPRSSQKYVVSRVRRCIGGKHNFVVVKNIY